MLNNHTHAICDVCRRIFKETRKRYYCEHCKSYHYVCKDCKTDVICPSCGVRLKYKTEPIKAKLKKIYATI